MATTQPVATAQSVATTQPVAATDGVDPAALERAIVVATAVIPLVIDNLG